MKARIGRTLGRAFQSDLVLIHPPSLLDFRTRRSFTGPIADVVPSSDQFDMYPVGLTSIASHLERNSYNVRIVNLASRMLRDPGFDPEAYLTRLNAPIYGIDLHWLPHAEDRGLEDRVEDLAGEEFVANLAVKALQKGVLPGSIDCGWCGGGGH